MLIEKCFICFKISNTNKQTPSLCQPSNKLRISLDLKTLMMKKWRNRQIEDELLLVEHLVQECSD
jgi:hypothetical protein